MKVDLYLPLEIIINILSRLPIKTILSCKSVCKPWLDLIESSEFSETHLSNSIVSVGVYHAAPATLKTYEILEIVHEPCPQNDSGNYNLLFGFEFPYCAYIHSSVNGLLLMCERGLGSLYVCNPITREYFKLPPSPPPPERQRFHKQTFGFGVSKETGLYKLVEINIFPREYCSECKIYTLGTRSWRSIKPNNQLQYKRGVGVFLNGNLHWLAYDSNRHLLICCLDLETELFSSFSLPYYRQPEPEFGCVNALGDCCVSALGDRLCICDNLRDEIVVWLMKEYGDEKSWTKEYSIKKGSDGEMRGLCFPVKVFENGDIWIAKKRGLGLVHYVNKARAIQESVPFRQYNYSLSFIGGAAFYTPSFLSLKMFAVENVNSF